MVKGFSLGSEAGVEVSVGTASGVFHTSMKSAPTAWPLIGWFCGGGPSDSTTDLPLPSCPVTMRLIMFSPVAIWRAR